ncbi:unnamed protein product [Strongylus vulgaris]|uniref:LIM zinc-binding domain-containing protein n=1 Tax=Strongylus vulgaris TaxID=40348 RepID=A0A3P7KE25_STRVU|nr:unnamed protein product [Strongylus vulgaris]
MTLKAFLAVALHTYSHCLGLQAFICFSGRQLIEKEDLLRFNNDFFHAYHFSCTHCRIALTNEARLFDKEWYCPRCFDMRCETCAGCHKPIDKQNERSTLALGKSFHHFRCAKCDEAFMGTKHYERNGKAYCKDDFMMLCGEFCYRCNSFLSGASVNVLGKKWCINCYRCLACDRVLEHRSLSTNFGTFGNCKSLVTERKFSTLICAQCAKNAFVERIFATT